MLNITNKTKRGELVAEIERLRNEATMQAGHHAHAETELRTKLEAVEAKLLEARTDTIHAERKCEILETDVHNLLGTIRVMADSSREVRIRASSVRSSDIALALPHRNTDKL